MRTVSIWLLCAIQFLVLLNIRVAAKNLVVATYNLWNVMFQWDSRKYYIADMVCNRAIHRGRGNRGTPPRNLNLCLVNTENSNYR